MNTHKRMRVLSVKIEPDSDTWKRLRELAWQQMRYKNMFLRGKWVEAMGYVLDPEKEDPHEITKAIRAEEKGELSGRAYTAAEAETRSAWTRDGKKVMAGAPLPSYRQKDSLSVMGHKKKSGSGIRIELEGGQFFADLQLQSKDCEGGCWFRIPIAKGTGEDDYQRPLLLGMVSWEVPIKSARIIFKVSKGKTYLQLVYEQYTELPEMGERVATLGPVSKNGMNISLRTECQTIDYSHKLTRMYEHKSHWDGVRRRVLRQIGRRRGSARSKRRKLSKISTQDWFKTFLHQWSREVIDWCHSQGVGTLVLIALGNGDWPAHQFAFNLKYKGEDLNIEVMEEAELEAKAEKRAVKREIQREREKAKKKLEAVRTLQMA